jgi:hypothetical protein
LVLFAFWLLSLNPAVGPASRGDVAGANDRHFIEKIEARSRGKASILTQRTIGNAGCKIPHGHINNRHINTSAARSMQPDQCSEV